MNRFFLTFCLFLPVVASAQGSATDRGSILVGGSAGFVSNGEASNLYVRPSAQYFVTRGLALGGSVGVNTDFEHTQFSGGPAVTYLFDAGESPLVPYLSGRLFFSEFTNRYTAAGGVLLLLNDHVGVTGELYYSHLDADSADDTFGLSFGIAAFVF